MGQGLPVLRMVRSGLEWQYSHWVLGGGTGESNAGWRSGGPPGMEATRAADEDDIPRETTRQHANEVYHRGKHPLPTPLHSEPRARAAGLARLLRCLERQVASGRAISRLSGRHGHVQSDASVGTRGVSSPVSCPRLQPPSTLHRLSAVRPAPAPGFATER